jgi:cell wall-associated NlpC family hydrolase
VRPARDVPRIEIAPFSVDSGPSRQHESTMPQRMLCKVLVTVTTLVATAAVGGCANITRAPARAVDAGTRPTPAREDRAQLTLGEAVAQLAVALVGTPYRYGGASPQDGFDCSGLVHYAFARAGLTVPRTSQEQYRAARKIAARAAAPGDLVFFQDQEKLSHVGIYLGDGRFVHAPETGRNVEIGELDAPYYQRHLVGVGRLAP